MPLVYVGLGSNLGDREQTIRAALARLEADPQIDVVAVSSLRETDPVGYTDQPKFLNGAAALRTDLLPSALLERLLQIERDLGRVLDHPRLTLPHPRLTEREFVLEPLAELDSDLEVPGRGSVRALLAALQ